MLDPVLIGGIDDTQMAELFEDFLQCPKFVPARGSGITQAGMTYDVLGHTG